MEHDRHAAQRTLGARPTLAVVCAPMSGATREFTEADLVKTVEQPGIVLVDWWAPWCAPCRSFAPIYEKVATKNPDVVFAKINTEDQPKLAQEFEIRAIPTLMVFRDGILLLNESGAVPQNVLEDVLTKVRAIDMEDVKRKIQEHEEKP
jgi:thioredoxin 1